MRMVYANIAWFILLIIGLTNATVSRYSSEIWDGMDDVRFNYTLLFGGITLLLAASIAGLLLKRKWGYELALASNLSMALLPLSLFVVSFVMLPSAKANELLACNAQNLVVGLISLFFLAAHVRSGIKAKYVRKNM